MLIGGKKGHRRQVLQLSLKRPYIYHKYTHMFPFLSSHLFVRYSDTVWWICMYFDDSPVRIFKAKLATYWALPAALYHSKYKETPLSESDFICRVVLLENQVEQEK